MKSTFGSLSIKKQKSELQPYFLNSYDGQVVDNLHVCMPYKYTFYV